MSNKSMKAADFSSLINVENMVKELQLTETESGFEKAINAANAMKSLRAVLSDEVMQPIMELQGTSIGFRTDKDSANGYAAPIVRDALIEAVLRGVQPAGNQFNIIAGRCYITKEGFQYLLKTLPGFSDLKPMLGIPISKPGGAIVKCSATWKMHGKADHIEAEIPIKVNNGMGSDAILGKATRKLLSRIYAQATGTDITDGSADEGEFIDVKTEVKQEPKAAGDELYGDDNLEMGGAE
jgi:hypothetical protein